MIGQMPPLAILTGDFSPLDVDPLFWHAPDDTTTLTTSGAAGWPFKGTLFPTLSSTSTDFQTGAAANFGWAGWVRMATGASSYTIVGKGEGASKYEWQLNVSGNVPRMIGYTAAGSGTTATWGSALTQGTWYHIACWRDVTAQKLYISVNNGTPVASASTSRPDAANTAAFMMGAFETTGSPGFVMKGGAIGPCGYWSRVLTQGASSDLSALYNGGVPVLYSSLAAGQLSGLVAYYDFDTVANLTSDRTGNGHTLTNTNRVQLAQGVTSAAISNGVKAQTWADKSGNGYHYAPPPGCGGPAYTTGVQNGLAMLLGDGSSTVLCSDAVATALTGNADTYAYFVVVKGVTVGSDFQQIFLAAGRNTGVGLDPVYELGVLGPAPGDWQGIEKNDAGTQYSVEGSTDPDSNAHVIAMVADATDFTVYLDGVSIGSHARPLGQVTVDMFTILSHRNAGYDIESSSGNEWTGYYGEDLLLMPAPDAGTLTTIFSYFRNRWGTP